MKGSPVRVRASASRKNPGSARLCEFNGVTLLTRRCPHRARTSAEVPRLQHPRADARPLPKFDAAKSEADMELDRHQMAEAPGRAVVDGTGHLPAWDLPLRIDAGRSRAEETRLLAARDVDEAASFVAALSRCRRNRERRARCHSSDGDALQCLTHRASSRAAVALASNVSNTRRSYAFVTGAE